MCFTNKDGFRLLTSRKFLCLSTNRFIYFYSKKYDQKISIDLVYDDGEFNLVLVNEDNKEETAFCNPKTGNYTFDLQKGTHYKLHMTSKKAYGSYRILIKKIK